MHKSKLIKFVLIIKNCCFPYFSNFTKIFIKLYFCSSSINCTYNMGGKIDSIKMNSAHQSFPYKRTVKIILH